MKLKGNEKILIIKPSAIGDILHSLPFIDRLKTAYPSLSISWVVNREYCDLLKDNPLIDQLFIFERKKWGKKRNLLKTLPEFMKFINEIKLNRFDIAIDLQGLFRSGLIAYLSDIKDRIGLSSSRELSRLFYNHLVNVNDKRRHAVDRYLRVSSYLGINGIHTKKVRFPMYWSKDAESNVDRFFTRNKLAHSDLKIAINPVSRWQSKCWIPDKYAQLADTLIESMGANIIFVGAKSDLGCIKKIIGLMKNTPVLAAGETSLQDLAVLLQRMDLMITNDSGPMHMAVAVGVPVVAIFGPTDPELTGPYGDNNIIIKKSVKCKTCFKKNCKLQECMNLITVEDVSQAVNIMVGKTKPVV